MPNKPCQSPHTNKLPTYGAKAQHTDDPDESPELNTIDTRMIQAIIRSSLYYGRVVDNELLVALSTIVMKKHSPTTFTRPEVHHLLDYVATRLDDGTISAHSDAECLSEPKAKNRASSHACLSKKCSFQPSTGLF